MAGYADCLRRVAELAGRALTDDEVAAIYTRVHKAALDIKAGRAEADEVGLGKKIGKGLGIGESADPLVQQAAQRAAAELEREAQQAERQAHLQLVRLGARIADYDRIKAAGAAPIEAARLLLARDYSGRYDLQSLEQLQTGYKDYFASKLLKTWDALGNDFLGFFQDREKALDLLRAMRGEPVKDPANQRLATEGARAWAETADETLRTFNENGGGVGKLDDWAFPQHHNQETVSRAKAILEAKKGIQAATDREAYVAYILPLLRRTRDAGKHYIDEFGQPWDDARLAEFAGKAWDTIATDGIANLEPGKSQGTGKRANRHAESRQIHFPDAEAYLDYWDTFGGRTVVEILDNHIGTMARDIAFVQHMGPNPNTTYQTLRDTALRDAALADPKNTPRFQGQAVKLDTLYDYAAGLMKPAYNQTLVKVADGIASLNVAGKLGGAALASLFGDKPMMEAVSHMNDLPALKRWSTELALLNPAATADRRLLQQQGLMLDSVRSGLQRFNEALGTGSMTGKIANAVMRVTGMQAINDIRKGAFGLSMMSAIGEQINDGVQFGQLASGDMRALRTFGVTEADWKTWQLAKLEKMVAGNDHVLTPEAIGRIPDADLRAAGVIAQVSSAEDAAKARRDAAVKLIGVVNTEGEFAIVTPGWQERALFYGDLQRGTVKGEIVRAMLQFKSFPWALLMRSMDAVANQDGPTGKAAMTAYIVVATTLAGAMLMQTREVLAGKDPRGMADENWMKFWGAAFIQGGALGIYGDFLYGANQTRFGSGILEVVSGPTIGPLLEMGLVQPMGAIRKRMEGKETMLAAQTLQDIKGFIPGSNIWYTKAALDHMIWQRVMEMVSPGYLQNIRSRTQKEYGQEWWWQPGEVLPERGPELGQAVRR